MCTGRGVVYSRDGAARAHARPSSLLIDHPRFSRTPNGMDGRDGQFGLGSSSILLPSGVCFFFFTRRWRLFNTRRGWHPNDFKKNTFNRLDANVGLTFRSFVRSFPLFFVSLFDSSFIHFFFFFFFEGGFPFLPQHTKFPFFEFLSILLRWHTWILFCFVFVQIKWT